MINIIKYQIFFNTMNVMFVLSALILLLSPKVKCHIGEPCNSLLKICLPPTNQMYCDSDHICRCKPEYPVTIGPHSCRKARKVSERCQQNEECTYYDVNSFCTQTPYSSVCECHDEFVYDHDTEKCIHQSSNNKKSSHFLQSIPMTAAIFVAFFSFLCCCILLWHNACRKHEMVNRNDQRMAIERSRRRVTQDQDMFEIRNAVNASNGRGGNTSPHLPPYETALILSDEPPPSYEDVIKEAEAAEAASKANQIESQ